MGHKKSLTISVVIVVAAIAASIIYYTDDIRGSDIKKENGIAKIERGESDPSLSTICKIADALDTDLDELLGTGLNERMREMAEWTYSLMERLQQVEKVLEEGKETPAEPA